MSVYSKIEWTDATWNPVRGCTKISPGCKHCYPESFAERFRGVPGNPYEHGFDLRLVPEKLTDPLRWSVSRMVFVNSMSDLFHEGVPIEYILTVARVMALANWHTFQVLTKRSERMRDLLNDPLRAFSEQLHIWWGVSVEDREYGLPRIEHLRAASAAVRFLSIEPLLEDLGQLDLSGISWVIVGGESGSRSRPIQPAWVESIRDQCMSANIPFFFKQWGGVHKDKTGRQLDNRTYDEVPLRAAVPAPTLQRRWELIKALENMPEMASFFAMLHPLSKSWISMQSLPSSRVKEAAAMTHGSNHSKLESLPLFGASELPQPIVPEPKVKQPRYPIWTENKAKLIERYLYYFVLVTRHGAYIDGFAGPQDPEKPETWAAKLVLDSEPRWLRQFHLFDQDKRQFARLNALTRLQANRETDPKDLKRSIETYHGDFNLLVHRLLASGSIKQTEATFCLLDQRTFECQWSTLEALATYKTTGHKIELFYFLPNLWFDRARAAQRDHNVLRTWWGRDDWELWLKQKPLKRRDVFVDRFKRELGYQSVKPWPIYERSDGGKTMYYMIHATDHPAAPELMSRAYARAIGPKESLEQLSLEFGLRPS